MYSEFMIIQNSIIITVHCSDPVFVNSEVNPKLVFTPQTVSDSGNFANDTAQQVAFIGTSLMPFNIYWTGKTYMSIPG